MNDNISILSHDECMKRKQDIADLFNQSFKYASKNNFWDAKEIKKSVCYSQKYPPYATILFAQKDNKIIGMISLIIQDVIKLNKDLKHALKKVDYNKDKIRIIQWLIVYKDYKNKGLGYLLLKKINTIKTKYSDLAIGLSCEKDKIDFYKKNNFQLIDYIEENKHSNKTFYFMIKK